MLAHCSLRLFVTDYHQPAFVPFDILSYSINIFFDLSGTLNRVFEFNRASGKFTYAESNTYVEFLM